MDAAEVIRLEGVTKRFGSVVAVDDISLSLRANEFFAVLGPSGCGKTTLLRLIAGFETPDTGRILLNGVDLKGVRPNHRPINMMFQSYAIFPHLSVFDNVAYGPRMERVKGEELERRVGEALEMVQLTDLAARKPHRLSGGERQRVALARALVKRPQVLLLDEPLAALDRKLREQMQLELKRLQHEVGITFVVVTHDQEEALVMADRIGLLDHGRLEQLGTARELYEYPKSHFVADFIGVMNFFRGRTTDGGVEVEHLGLLRGDSREVAPGAQAYLAVRPEKIALDAAAPTGGGENCLSGTVESVAYFGDDLQVHVRVAGVSHPLVVRVDSAVAERLSLAEGSIVWCSWPAASSRILTL